MPMWVDSDWTIYCVLFPIQQSARKSLGFQSMKAIGSRNLKETFSTCVALNFVEIQFSLVWK